MASDKIDMSLEDIIKSNRQSGKGGASSRGFRGGRGGARGGRGRGFARNNYDGQRSGAPRGGVQNRRPPPMPYVRPTQVPDVWEHDLYEGDGRSRGAMSRGAAGPRVIPRGDGTGTLLISNLDFGVNDSDITELFGEFGFLKKAAVHYDKSGRSLGTAEVVYEKSLDASKAMKQYNNVPLDGKPMKITIVGGEESRPERTMSSRIGPAPVRQPREIYQPRGGFSDRQRSFGGRGGGRGAGGRETGFRGGRGGSRGGRGGGGDARKAVSKEDLDAQLDAYNAKMETN